MIWLAQWHIFVPFLAVLYLAGLALLLSMSHDLISRILAVVLWVIMVGFTSLAFGVAWRQEYQYTRPPVTHLQTPAKWWRLK